MTIVKIINMSIMKDLSVTTGLGMEVVMSFVNGVNDLNRSVMITVAIVSVMKLTINNIIEMISMRDNRMTAVGRVDMIRFGALITLLLTT